MKISNELIRSFAPCYDPSEVVQDENEVLPIAEWVAKYRDSVKNKADIIWLFCREDFFSAKDLRLFAVWCAREALKLVENPDPRSVDACNVAERFATGEATSEELAAAWAAARAAAGDAAGAAAWDAAWAAAWAAAGDAAMAARPAAWAARAATWDAALDAAWAAAGDAAWAAARAAAGDAGSAARAAAGAAGSAARDAQIDKLLTLTPKP